MARLNDIYQGLEFNNDGELDLATGTIAPIKFYELMQREIDYSKRAKAPLTVISTGVAISESSIYWVEKSDISIEESELLISILLDFIINISFKITRTLRSSDSMARLGVLTFALLIRDDLKSGEILSSRINTVMEYEFNVLTNELQKSTLTGINLEIITCTSSYKDNWTLSEFLNSASL